MTCICLTLSTVHVIVHCTRAQPTDNVLVLTSIISRGAMYVDMLLVLKTDNLQRRNVRRYVISINTDNLQRRNVSRYVISINTDNLQRRNVRTFT